MVKNSYEVRAQRFIEQIDPYMEEAFEYYEDGYRYTDKFCQAVMNFEIDHPKRSIKCASGAARFAIITADYVIKMDYDKDGAETYGGSEEEITFYSVAEEEGYAYLFAKVSRYVYNGHWYYIMPRINNIGRGNGYGEHYMTEEEQMWCADRGLTDLHRRNYGFRNNRICIVDYANYWGLD